MPRGVHRVPRRAHDAPKEAAHETDVGGTPAQNGIAHRDLPVMSDPAREQVSAVLRSEADVLGESRPDGHPVATHQGGCGLSLAHTEMKYGHFFRIDDFQPGRERAYREIVFFGRGKRR